MVLERQVASAFAVNAAMAEIAKLGLLHKITTIGERNKIQTYKCVLFDQSEREVSVGNGKGLGEQSLASAVFEALEHFFVAFPPTEGIVEIELRELLNHDLLSKEAVFQTMIRWNPSTRLFCRIYKPLHDGNEIYYPVFLSAPGQCLPEVPLSALVSVTKYATNNGTATGMGKTEALIHAVSEIVERDSIACFLLQAFIARRPVPSKEIDPGSLPTELLNLMMRAKAIIRHKIQLLDITTELGIPAILAVSHVNGYPVPFVGSGASLSKDYAIERALLETVQSFHLYNGTLRRDDETAMRSFSDLPRYQDCLRLDLTRCKLVPLAYDDMVPFNKPSNLEEHLIELVNRIFLRGYRVFFNSVYSSDSGIDCVHCIIPGLEKFHLVRSGNPVLPSDRGLKLVR